MEYADRLVDVAQLNREIDELGLPGIRGVARLSRRRDKKGILRSVTPYILVKVKGLSATQEAKVAAAVASHVPTARPIADGRIEA